MHGYETAGWIVDFLSKLDVSCDIRESRISVPNLHSQNAILSILCCAFPQFFTNPIWIASQIEHSKNLRLFAIFSIIDTKRETARQHPVKFEVQRMNAAETGETLDIGQ